MLTFLLVFSLSCQPEPDSPSDSMRRSYFPLPETRLLRLSVQAAFKYKNAGLSEGEYRICDYIEYGGEFHEEDFPGPRATYIKLCTDWSKVNIGSLSVFQPESDGTFRLRYNTPVALPPRYIENYANGIPGDLILFGRDHIGNHATDYRVSLLLISSDGFREVFHQGQTYGEPLRCVGSYQNEIIFNGLSNDPLSDPVLSNPGTITFHVKASKDLSDDHCRTGDITAANYKMYEHLNTSVTFTFRGGEFQPTAPLPDYRAFVNATEPLK